MAPEKLIGRVFGRQRTAVPSKPTPRAPRPRTAGRDRPSRNPDYSSRFVGRSPKRKSRRRRSTPNQAIERPSSGAELCGPGARGRRPKADGRRAESARPRGVIGRARAIQRAWVFCLVTSGGRGQIFLQLGSGGRVGCCYGGAAAFRPRSGAGAAVLVVLAVFPKSRHAYSVRAARALWLPRTRSGGLAPEKVAAGPPATDPPAPARGGAGRASRRGHPRRHRNAGEAAVPMVLRQRGPQNRRGFRARRATGPLREKAFGGVASLRHLILGDSDELKERPLRRWSACPVYY